MRRKLTMEFLRRLRQLSPTRPIQFFEPLVQVERLHHRDAQQLLAAVKTELLAGDLGDVFCGLFASLIQIIQQASVLRKKRIDHGAMVAQNIINRN